MSKWLALVDEYEEISKPLPDTPTEPDKTPCIQPKGANCRVMSGCQVRGKEKPDTLVDSSPYGHTASGRQLTWTGKIVSLDAWRDLSEWERHGSTGKFGTG